MTKNVSYNLIQLELKKAASDLDIEIICPFTLLLSSGKKIATDGLIKYFGSKKGMIIVTT